MKPLSPDTSLDAQRLPLSVLSQVTSILEQEGISYVLVGSFASSLHGMYRSTTERPTDLA